MIGAKQKLADDAPKYGEQGCDIFHMVIVWAHLIGYLARTYWIVMTKYYPVGEESWLVLHVFCSSRLLMFGNQTFLGSLVLDSDQLPLPTTKYGHITCFSVINIDTPFLDRKSVV